jgi:uncharacterized membrane protein YjjP (DUF1212 family)
MTTMRSDLIAEFRAIRAEHRSDFRWLLGTMLGLSGAGFALMAHGFHWLQ